MGLDMYLEKEYYIGAHYKHLNVTGSVEIIQNGIPSDIKLKEVSTITTRVGYWRKANAIHRWFVDNIQYGVDECQRSYCSTENLRKLYDICFEVKENPEKAMELLPPQEGFFFGSTEIDEWYWQDIDDTIKILKPLLTEANKNYGIYYQSSW